MIYSSKSFFSFRAGHVEVQELVLDQAWRGGELKGPGIVEGSEQKEQEF